METILWILMAILMVLSAALVAVASSHGAITCRACAREEQGSLSKAYSLNRPRSSAVAVAMAGERTAATGRFAAPDAPLVAEVRDLGLPQIGFGQYTFEK